MPSSNGSYKIAIGVIVFGLTILGSGMAVYNQFHVPLANAIETEKDARISEDKQLRENIVVACAKQQDSNMKIEKCLERLLVKVEYIEQKVK